MPYLNYIEVTYHTQRKYLISNTQQVHSHINQAALPIASAAPYAKGYRSSDWHSTMPRS